MIFNKSLRLSQVSLGAVDSGKVVNLSTTDAVKFEYGTWTSPYLWITPLNACVMIYFLYDLIQLSGVIGFIIIILLLPLQAKQSTLVGKQTKLAQEWADKRLKVTKELIGGMRIMKMFAWENTHAENISAQREGELEHVKQKNIIRASMNAYSMSALGIYCFGTFMIYHFMGNELTAEKVYGTISIFMLLKWQVASMFPFSVLSWVDMKVSSKRISEFLNLNEFKQVKGAPQRNNHNKLAKALQESNDAQMRDYMTDGVKFTEVVGSEQKAVTISYNAEKGELVSSSNRIFTLNTIKELYSARTAMEKSPELKAIVDADTMIKSNQCVTIACKAAEERTEEDHLQLIGATPAAVKRFITGLQVVIKLDKNKDAEAKTSSVSDASIALNNATAYWNPDSDTPDNRPCLKNIDLEVKGNEFVAIIGQVGSGKSSLLYSLLGELPVQRGTLNVKGSVAYTAQVPWGFSGSIKSNIVMKNDFDEKRFEDATHFAAMDPDLQKFDNGVLTEVGENGITLSGGQKARLSLARALFDDADIYLFDDPLSAVDPEVGKFLFEDCMRDYLSNKLRVLVTHQIQFVKDCDRIIVMNEDGSIAQQGTYAELLAAGCELLEDNTDDAKHEVAEEKVDTDAEKAAKKLKKAGNDSKEGKLAVEEKTETGSVSWDVYKQYFSFLGGGSAIVLIVFSGVFAQTVTILVDMWLARWVDSNNQGDDIFPVMYAVLLILSIFFAFIRSAVLFVTMLKGSKVLHDRMLNSLIRTPISWIDFQPAGRIMNRFSMDLFGMDNTLLMNVDMCFFMGMGIIGALVLVSVLSPFVILLIIPGCVYFIKTRRFYVRTSREVKRLEAVSRSPVQNTIVASFLGLVTIRSMNLQNHYKNDFQDVLDTSTRGRMAYFYIIRWLGVRLDFISAMVVVGASILSVVTVIADVSLFPAAYVGLALTQTLGLMAAFQMAVRQSAEIENEMTSVERILAYTVLPQEAETRIANVAPPNWPKRGHIVVKNLKMRYAPSLPLVLKNVNLEFKPLQKIGIVGRTGSGKSTFLNVCFFRMVEFEGLISIDGVDISKLGLHDLRERIGVIPQDPTLFNGSVRYNLDPFKQNSNEELWDALEAASMKKYVEEMEDGLDSLLTDGGANLSVGQRQLICLARAIARKSKVLVVDEATANVDLATDVIIQKNIRETFKDCTVLVVAHRLNTIIDSDMVVVFDYGDVVECAAPHELLQNEDGYFSKMLSESGSHMEAKLKQMAADAFPAIKAKRELAHAEAEDDFKAMESTTTAEQNDVVNEDAVHLHFKVHQDDPSDETAPAEAAA